MKHNEPDARLIRGTNKFFDHAAQILLLNSKVVNRKARNERYKASKAARIANNPDPLRIHLQYIRTKNQEFFEDHRGGTRSIQTHGRAKKVSHGVIKFITSSHHFSGRKYQINFASMIDSKLNKDTVPVQFLSLAGAQASF